MAQKAPRDALKEAQKLENRTRLQNQSQKLGATRTKNTRYAAGMVKVDLIRASLGKRGFIRSSLPTFYGVQTLSKDTRQLNAKMKSILPSQVSFAQAEYDKKKKRTRRELFLEQMEQVVPWARLIEVIEPHYPKSGKRGRPPTGWPRAIGLERMLRMYFVQQWYALADEAVEDAVYDSQALRNFMSIDLSQQSVPDATTLMGFRHLLEANDLPQAMLVEVNALLIERGLLRGWPRAMSKGTLVDATLIAAPSSTKNQAHGRDPEMHQAKKGNQWRGHLGWYFGLKAHIGVDKESGLVHTLVTTSANVSDISQTPALLHGQEAGGLA